jgi:TolB-like protein/Tfp pilus assembly protein PilF
MNVPAAFQRIVDKVLKKDPELRYQTIADLIADLKDIRRMYESHAGHELATASSTQPTIAVLPFNNLSADREQEYFCDGMAEEIINALSHIEGLHVVARTSAFSFKDKIIDIREIGRKLGVRTVLEGSVRKAGNRLRITTQLIDIDSGYHLWSEKFDRDMEDIFGVQDEISLAIVENLRVRLLAGEKDKLMKRYTDNPDAYSLYLKGRYFWNRRYEGGLQKGIEYFEQAIGKDPLYAPAYVGIADCYNQYGFFGYRPAGEAYSKAKEAVAKALEIDDTLSEAYSCLGWIKTFYDWEWEDAEKAFLKALKLGPNSALAHNWYGLLLAVTGRQEESEREGDKSLEIDPVSLIFNAVRGLGYYWSREHDKGIELLKKTLEMDPGFSLALLFLGFTYTATRMWEEAAEILRKFAALSMNSSVGAGHLGLVYGLAGRNREAREVLSQLTEMSPQRYVSPLYFALVYMGLGDNDRAFEYLYKAVKERDSWMATLKYAPFFDSIRSDPRYPGLLKEVGQDC